MTRAWMLVWALVLGATSISTASAQLLPGNSKTHNLNHDARLRSYRAQVPAGVPSSAAILVVLHGGGLGTAQQVEEGTGFSALAADYGFVAIYPQGVLNTWNAGECCGAAVNQGVNDVGFIAAAVADARARYGLSGGPVYATGISNGGMMAYRLACERPDLFRGVAPVAATVVLPACFPAAPADLLHIHGLQDQYVPYEGGYPKKGLSRTHNRRPVPDSVQVWTQANGCDGAHPDTARSRRPGQTETAGSGCERQVRLVTLEGAAHTWPGSTGVAGSVVVDPDYPDYDASARIVDFFGLSD